jgi:hypothetical protein
LELASGVERLGVFRLGNNPGKLSETSENAGPFLRGGLAIVLHFMIDDEVDTLPVAARVF